MSDITIYTDGAYNLATQCGSWVAIIYRDDEHHVITGTAQRTSSNRMELTAVIRALESIEPAGQRVEIRSDSQYVVCGVSEWLPGWVRNGWVTGIGKPVANRDLWQQVRAFLICHNVTMVWIPRRENAAGEMIQAK